MTEVEYLRAKLADDQAALDRERKKECLRKLAENTHDCYQAFSDVGFSDEQSWWLTQKLFGKCQATNL